MDQEQLKQNEEMSGAGSSPADTAVPAAGAPEEKKHVGPMIGIVIIVAVIILGGLYFLEQRAVDTTESGMTAQEVMQVPDETLNALETQGVSDEVADIEADLTDTDLSGLDAELEDIEAQLVF